MADGLHKVRVTMQPEEWLFVDDQERDSLRKLGILLEGPTQMEIAQQVAKEAAAAANPKKNTRQKGKTP